MQTVILMAIFAMLFSVMASIVSLNSTSTDYMRVQEIQNTKAYMNKLAKVINEQLTAQYYHANPNNVLQMVDYMKSWDELKSLTIGKGGDTFVDAWNRPITGNWRTETITLIDNGISTVRLPVTGFLLISAGPDGVVQTVIPNLVKANDVFGVAAAGDDIVFAFDNFGAQKQLFQNIEQRMNRIAAASINNLEGRLNDQQKILLAAYQAKVKNGENPLLSSIDLATDNTVKFLPINSLNPIADCRKIGISEECEQLLRLLPISGTKFKLSGDEPATTMTPLKIVLENESLAPTPWPGFKFTVTADIRATSVN